MFPGSVDLDVTEFTLASMVLNMALGFLEVTDLEVTISSSNMPSRSSDKPLFDFSYVVVGEFLISVLVESVLTELPVVHTIVPLKLYQQNWF